MNDRTVRIKVRENGILTSYLSQYLCLIIKTVLPEFFSSTSYTLKRPIEGINLNKSKKLMAGQMESVQMERVRTEEPQYTRVS